MYLEDEMTMWQRAFAWSAWIAMIAGCANNPAVVPLAGRETDVAHLVGEWVGEYQSAQTGRVGSIVFTLAATADTAYGDVLMIPRGAGGPISPAGQTGPFAQRPSTDLLTIRFVRISNHHVNGSLDAYRDPQCGCTLLTTFEGEHTDDRIAGTFSSRHRESGRITTGDWWVRRKH